MDSINFKVGDNFPMYREALIRLQDMGFLLSELSVLGGQNYILSGCLESKDGKSVGDGFIVIDGELLPFVGGSKLARIEIKETRVDVKAEIKNPPFEQLYPELYINRVAQFSAQGELFWEDFKRAESLAELSKKIKDIQGDAPGTVKMWAGMLSKVPKEYMLCNGDELSVDEYAELFETLGTSFGGDGTNNFKLPDLRGRFIVGYDNANPDYNAINSDKKGGYQEVNLEVKHLPSHNHTNGKYFNKLSAKAADIDSTNTPGVDDRNPDSEYRVGGMSPDQWEDATIQSVGGNKPHENRPPYFTLAYIIKVR